MSIPEFKTSDIYLLELKDNEAQVKGSDKKMPIQTAINIFKDLYRNEKNHLSPEEKEKFKARFNTLFHSYLTKGQEEEIYDIFTRPAPMEMEPEVECRAVYLEPFKEDIPCSVEEALKNKPGFFKDDKLLASKIGKEYYFICPVPNQKEQFMIFTSRAVYFGLARKNSLLINNNYYSSLEKFVNDHFPDLKPLPKEGL